MRVRREQFECLAEERRGRFAAEMVPLIRDLCPRETGGVSDLDLRRIVEASVRAGERFRLRLDKDFVVFTAMALRIGPGFHDDAAVRRYLEDPLLARDECMERMLREIPPSEWARIKARQQGATAARM